jgi:hypothetical protein
MQNGLTSFINRHSGNAHNVDHGAVHNDRGIVSEEWEGLLDSEERSTCVQIEDRIELFL